MKISTVFLASLLVVGNLAVQGADDSLGTILSGKPIHPMVFNMILSYESDTASPVVTAVNLDAVLKDRNQFDYSRVRTNGDWITFEDPDKVGSSAYKMVSASNHIYKIMYKENGGGSLTTVSYISFRIEPTTVMVNGNATRANTLVVSGIDDK